MDIGQKLNHINSWYFLVCAIFLSSFLVPSIFHSQFSVKVDFFFFFFRNKLVSKLQMLQQIGSIWINCYINSAKQSFKPSQSRNFTLIHKQESQIELNLKTFLHLGKICKEPKFMKFLITLERIEPLVTNS